MNDRPAVTDWRAPLPRAARLVKTHDVVTNSGVNKRLAIAVTGAVGTMWAFYLFAIIEFGWMIWQSRGPGALIHDPYPFAFLLFLGNIIQLLLMPLIMVGQNVQSAHADARAESDYKVNTKAEVEIEKVLRGLAEISDRLEKLEGATSPTK